MSKVSNAAVKTNKPQVKAIKTGKQEPVPVEPKTVKPAKAKAEKKTATLTESLSYLLSDSRPDVTKALNDFAQAWGSAHNMPQLDTFAKLVNAIDSINGNMPKGHVNILRWWFGLSSKARGYHVVLKPSLFGRQAFHNDSIIPLAVARDVKEHLAIVNGLGVHLAIKDGKVLGVFNSRNDAHKALNNA